MVNFYFGCYTLSQIVLGLMRNWQYWQSSCPRWWNILDQSQPNSIFRAKGAPCTFLLQLPTDLAYEENSLGRFLKENGKADRTKAGKMMVAVGKTMSYSGQQRLAIRVPLVRLYQGREYIQMSSLIATYNSNSTYYPVSYDQGSPVKYQQNQRARRSRSVSH